MAENVSAPSEEKKKGDFRENSRLLREKVRSDRERNTSADAPKEGTEVEVLASHDTPPKERTLADECGESDFYTVRCLADGAKEDEGEADAAAMVELRYPIQNLRLSSVLKTMLESDVDFREKGRKEISFPHVTETVFRAAMRYLELQHFNPGVEFHFEITSHTAFELLNFAHFLGAEKLLDLCCRMVGHYLPEVPSLEEVSEDLLVSILPHCRALDLADVERREGFFPEGYSTAWVWEQLYNKYLVDTTRWYRWYKSVPSDQQLFMKAILDEKKPSYKELYGSLYVQDKVNGESLKRLEETKEAIEYFGDTVFQLQARNYLFQTMGGIKEALESFPNLFALDLSAIQAFSSASAMEQLGNAVAGLPCLRYLEITASDVTSRSVEAFFCSFVNSKGDWTTVEEGNRPLLREVLFHNNCIGPKGASAIAAFLGSSLGVAVETIGLSRNPILEGGLAHLLYSLSLQKKAIERKRAKSQAAESELKGCQELHVHGCFIDASTFPHGVCEALENSNIETLIMSKNRFQRDAEPIDDGMWIIEGGTHMRRRYRDFGNDEKAKGPSSEERKAEAFRNESDALMENPIPLLLRRAGDNEASSAGMELKALLFTHLPSTLKRLELSTCRISGPNLKVLLRELGARHRSVECLDLRANPSDFEKGELLAAVVDGNPSLRTLLLSNFAVGGDSFPALMEAILRASSLREVQLSHASLSAQHVEELISRLIALAREDLPTVKKLELQGNGFMDPARGRELQEEAATVGVSLRVAW